MILRVEVKSLKMLRLEDKMHHKPLELSGGNNSAWPWPGRSDQTGHRVGRRTNREP